MSAESALLILSLQGGNEERSAFITYQLTDMHSKVIRTPPQRQERCWPTKSLIRSHFPSHRWEAVCIFQNKNVWLHFSPELKAAEDSRGQEEVMILESQEEVSWDCHNSWYQSWSQDWRCSTWYSWVELGWTDEHEACALSHESCFLEQADSSETRGGAKRKKKQARDKWR